MMRVFVAYMWRVEMMRRVVQSCICVSRRWSMRIRVDDTEASYFREIHNRTCKRRGCFGMQGGGIFDVVDNRTDLDTEYEGERMALSAAASVHRRGLCHDGHMASGILLQWW